MKLEYLYRAESIKGNIIQRKEQGRERRRRGRGFPYCSRRITKGQVPTHRIKQTEERAQQTADKRRGMTADTRQTDSREWFVVLLFSFDCLYAFNMSVKFSVSRVARPGREGYLQSAAIEGRSRRRKQKE